MLLEESRRITIYFPVLAEFDRFKYCYYADRKNPGV